jgi:hypothetical protein
MPTVDAPWALFITPRLVESGYAPPARQLPGWDDGLTGKAEQGLMEQRSITMPWPQS